MDFLGQRNIYNHNNFLIAVHIDELYCFHYKSTPDDLPKSAGWNFFDIQTEYQRMNVPNDQWVLCTANKDYEVFSQFLSVTWIFDFVFIPVKFIVLYRYAILLLELLGSYGTTAEFQ